MIPFSSHHSRSGIYRIYFTLPLFLQILTKIAEVDTIVKENKDLLTIIALLGTYTRKELGFMCES